ncbi:hypothetical protein ACRE_026620 [Hapsidospora chrysogenum ATCC 11550]|uniref:Uncharacterized protein n=1 Tax=Hapsidospora chrysogenum (strain ATCC 11550 / CBS 779.69 / DSM 880 / IAM 14645 / JCM 23072 / IMI 49137) TaxID=857340 RepID=A0A086TB11_HAPC1|nr:hypothetical protein ACRE_026620 [Hapsidospora chrysogenum ATCC 11550]
MLRSSTLLLALAACLGAAHETIGRSGLKGSQANLLLPGGNSAALRLRATCDVGEADCDGFCIPEGEVCCGDGDGSSCSAGKYCTLEGCCPKGEFCTGSPTGCDDGKELCGKYCIPDGSVCCEEANTYCEKGESCTSDGFCETGSGGSSDDDDDDLDGTSGSGTCLSSQEECDGYCMPAGSVCCGDGYYCYEGETCTDDGKCDSGSESSSTNATEDTAESSETDSADDDNDDEPTETDSSSSEPTSESGSTLCRRKGGKSGSVDVDSDEDDGCADGAEDDDDDAAAGLAVPAVLAGLMAMVPLFL